MSLTSQWHFSVGFSKLSLTSQWQLLKVPIPRFLTRSQTVIDQSTCITLPVTQNSHSRHCAHCPEWHQVLHSRSRRNVIQGSVHTALNAVGITLQITQNLHRRQCVHSHKCFWYYTPNHALCTLPWMTLVLHSGSHRIVIQGSVRTAMNAHCIDITVLFIQ